MSELTRTLEKRPKYFALAVVESLEEQLAHAQQEAKMWKGQHESLWTKVCLYMDNLTLARALLEPLATLDVVPNTSGDFACPFCDLSGVLFIPTVENFHHTHDADCPIVKARAFLAQQREQSDE